MPECFVEERSGHERQKPDPGGLSGLLGRGGERHEKGEDGCEHSTYDHHAVCRPITAAIFRHPSILRNFEAGLDFRPVIPVI